MFQPVLSILLLWAALPTADDVVDKCRHRSLDAKPLFALDGKLIGPDATALEQVSAADIHAVEILCMDPQDSTFNRSSGVPVVSVWTKQGPATLLEPTLAAIVAGQDAYYRKHRKYADDPGQLALPPYPPVFIVEMLSGDSGWVAAITMKLYLATCYAFDGNVQPLPAGLSPRKPQCVSASNAGRQG